MKFFLVALRVYFSLCLVCFFSDGFSQNEKIVAVKKTGATTVELSLNNNQHILLDFYGDNIFRLMQDSVQKSFREPEAKPEAQILVANSRKPVSLLSIKENNSEIIITNSAVQIVFDKSNTLFKVLNKKTNKIIIEEEKPINIGNSRSIISLKENADEYYFGGGIQNGRFSHKGKSISIENQNSWTDGGVASPNPFYWSTAGYGFMWYTFKKGKYDFGAKEKGLVNLEHESSYADVFFMIDDDAKSLLNDFYTLTGKPVLLPKFAFYEGHLNAYNRDFWKEDSAGILFEDGKMYEESQKDNGGVKESLNGEKNNYQFSARAVIDRYKNNDMPLGWILPNDGYGAGYGQTGTLDSNIANLKSFGDYARAHGVQIGLWTQSDLHPKPDVEALLQRNIIKEVKVAGVRVLKTDVAWVGAGYSFGLNGVADVAKITNKYGNNARPFIISLDGWAGTQRYASIWTGDQTGGQWEYIRFHIPTYIGSGLSGQPNITSDMDGIFGGRHPQVNIRDFQWKTFTPMQLNMDGWGYNPKYPHILGEPAASINRNYLKWKSSLLPYTYSIAKEAVNGLPIIRPMFMQAQNAYTLGAATRYQFMYGPYFLIAPIYQNTNADSIGNDIRNNIYLPKGNWIDYFTGAKYEGDRILNYFESPIWKLPVFVKPGAIIPLNNANNNVSEINKSQRIFELYPCGKSIFIEYDDDGTTELYKKGEATTTQITTTTNNEHVSINIDKTKGRFNGFVRDKETILKINVSAKPTNIKARINNTAIKLVYANSEEAFKESFNVVYYDEQPEFNLFATKGSDFEKVHIKRNPQLLIKLQKTDVANSVIDIQIDGYVFDIKNKLLNHTGKIKTPVAAAVNDTNATAFKLNPSWQKEANADFYEILFNDNLYTNIKDTFFLFDDLMPETDYQFQLRAVNKSTHSAWVKIDAKTKPNPLQFAIKNTSAISSVAAQEGFELSKLFDFDEGDDWHTDYDTKAIPFEITMDLKSVNQLDKIQYLPRSSGKNGIITKATIYYSVDKKEWSFADSITWDGNNNLKEFTFKNRPIARYVKMNVNAAIGDFGSGREIYIFKVPASASYIPGDINNDGKIDSNDLVSYINYTGLQKGDGDFEGYIGNGDINKNNIIDAFDISNVATQLEGGVGDVANDTPKLSGIISITPNKKSYLKDEIIYLTVRGNNLKEVNALSFALPYDPNRYEYIGIEPKNIGEMENLTNDRLHTNGNKVLYPTFVNIGDKKTLSGNSDLFIIKFKTKNGVHFNLSTTNGILVDKKLNEAFF